ncbi:MAG: type II secretion system minor pseudopilin GspK [Gammaproteobacteria bacterium]
MIVIRKQKGVALLAAMMIMVVGVTLAVNLLWSAHIQNSRTRTLNYLDEARLNSLGAEAFVAKGLTVDAQETQWDSLDELWATPQSFPIERNQGIITVTVSVEDMQSRFNVNNLVTQTGQKDEVWFNIFVRMLILLEIDPQIADAVVDWIDADVDITFPTGAEDDAYTGFEPAYRAANTYLTDVSELRAIQGIEGPVWLALKPHVAALPRGTLINVNTASEIVLASLGDGVTVFDAQLITENRIGEPYETLDQVSAFLTQDALAGATVSTEYFGISSVVELGTAQFSMYSLLERDQRGGSVAIRLRRSGYE